MSASSGRSFHLDFVQLGATSTDANLRKDGKNMVYFHPSSSPKHLLSIYFIFNTTFILILHRLHVAGHLTALDKFADY